MSGQKLACLFVWQPLLNSRDCRKNRQAHFWPEWKKPWSIDMTPGPQWSGVVWWLNVQLWVCQKWASCSVCLPLSSTACVVCVWISKFKDAHDTIHSRKCSAAGPSYQRQRGKFSWAHAWYYNWRVWKWIATWSYHLRLQQKLIKYLMGF